MYPAVARPRFASGFAGTRHRPEAPRELAGPGLVRVEKPADARFAPAHADDDFVPNDQRRSGNRVAEFVVADVHRPALDARARIEREEVSVERADEHGVVQDSNA